MIAWSNYEYTEEELKQLKPFKNEYDIIWMVEKI